LRLNEIVDSGRGVLQPRAQGVDRFGQFDDFGYGAACLPAEERQRSVMPDTLQCAAHLLQAVGHFPDLAGGLFTVCYNADQ
jgi:hypothetical protein